MRTFVHIWAMCLHLVLTNPMYWVAVVLVAAGAGGSPSRLVWPAAFGGAAIACLSCTVAVEGGAGLYDRIRAAQAGGLFIAGAAGAVMALSLAGGALMRLLGY